MHMAVCACVVGKLVNSIPEVISVFSLERNISVPDDTGVPFRIYINRIYFIFLLSIIFNNHDRILISLKLDNLLVYFKVYRRTYHKF
jgi:hypothetical protein